MLNVRNLLTSLLGSAASYADVTDLVNLCHKIALAYLRTKVSGGRFDPTRFGLTVEDLAYDAIAELFARNEVGDYITITSFAQRLGPLESLSDDGLLIALRRLVFGAVNQHVFRLYGSFDPSLARIIRNIKLALKRHPLVTTREQHRETMILPRGEQFLNEHLPTMAPEFLLPELYSRISAGFTLKVMLSGLGDVLREQTSYRKMVPLVEIAILVRTIYASDMCVKTEESPHITLSESEIEHMIDGSIASLRNTTAAAYVPKGKLAEEELCSHLRAVRGILCAEFFGENGQPQIAGGEPTSYYEILKIHFPSLTPDLYRAKHRVILEYFAKLARNDLKERLKHEF